MATFGFGKQTPDDEGIPPEPVEGETGVMPPEETEEKPNRMRRPLIIAGIGVVLAGGLYLANSLFFSAPPSPPARPPAPAPVATAPVTPPPTKEATPPAAPPKADTKAPVKAESKPGTSALPTSPPPPALPAPAKATAPAKAPVTPPPAKAEPAKTPEAKVPAKPATVSTRGYSVQVGAMAVEENAQKLKQKLDEMGFQAVIRQGSGFGSRHVVTIGEPTTRGAAEELSRRLNVDGFTSQLTSVEGRFTPQVGSFVSLDEAIDLSRELQKKNYRPKITSSTKTGVLFQVRHGQFDTRAAAVKRGEELKAKGFNAWVVPN
jgi:cell division septation protein DedD